MGHRSTDNETPTLGWQFSFSDKEENVGFYFGGQHGAGDDNDNKNWEQFFDWVLTASAGVATLVIANGDYQLTRTAKRSAEARGLRTVIAFSSSSTRATSGDSAPRRAPQRNETTATSAGGDTGLATGTITLRYKPVQYLVHQPRGSRRVELAGDLLREVFGLGGGPLKKQNYAAILGFTAYISN